MNDQETILSSGVSSSSRVWQKSGRPKIAFFCSPLDPSLNYEKRRVWLGMCQVAQARDANLLYVAGGRFARSPAAVLYELIDTWKIDGIVSWVPFVGGECKAQELCTFLGRYHPRPVLNIGWVVEGVKSLSFDNVQGMRHTIEHLVQVHCCRRIAYCGRRSASLGLEIRYQAFERVMREAGLFDPTLVVAGPLELLDQRHRWPGRDYEAVVVEGDTEAAALIRELEAHSVRVPTDILVTGFHDGQEARFVCPPLTTVHMPYMEMGRRATELILAAISGQEIPDQTYVPLALTVRRSCSCWEPPLIGTVVGSHRSSAHRVLSSMPTQQQESVVSKIAQSLGAARGPQEHTWAQRLLTALMGELMPDMEHDGRPDLREGFLEALDQILRESAETWDSPISWQGAVSEMRQAVLPYLQGQTAATAEDLWHQARVCIGQAVAQRRAYDDWQVDQRSQILHEIEYALAATSGMDELVAILASEMPRLGISRCYLVMYIDPANPTAESRLLLAYDERGRVDLPSGGLRFPSRELLPESVLSPEARCDLIVSALHVGDEQLGYLVLETSLRADTRQDTTCENLRSQISSALKGVLLRQQAIQADRLKSRFLSMVSHELRTPLNLLVNLSELTLEELASLGERDDASIARLTHYHQQILSGAQHLDHLILDVLDLARSQVEEMQLNCARLNLRDLLLETAAIGESLAQQKDLEWRFDVPCDLPPVRADRTRLRQVILNLLNNAVKFTASGYVSLEAQAGDDEITVRVRDSGLGIPVEDQKAIFDEFRQSERTVARGHRGMGLGLAISRRLIELHGGVIGVNSSGEEGRGSTFHFTLPALSEGHREVPSTQAGARTTLLLTHDAGAADILSQQLADRGLPVDVLELKQLEHWLEPVVASLPRAILMDSDLVTERGWAIIKALKAHSSTRHTPIILYSLPKRASAGSVLQVDYVPKSEVASELLQALDRYGLVDDSSPEIRTVLVVEDEPVLLDTYASMVRTHLPGCHVLRAEDGDDAVEVIRRRQPDLVVLDLLMPRMSGFEVLEAMRDLETTRHIPVIVLTGQTLTERDVSRLNQGVGAILSKGVFSVEETVAHIEAALSGAVSLGSEAQRFARQAIAYVHTRFAEPISSAHIAKHLNIHQNHLIRCFREQLGITPMTYLRRWRVKQAQRLLETTDQSVTEVALGTGFSSQSYFSRVFREEVGLTPTAYRRRCRRGAQGPVYPA